MSNTSVVDGLVWPRHLSVITLSLANFEYQLIRRFVTTENLQERPHQIRRPARLAQHRYFAR
jgi:hypothetical protein